MREEDKEYLKWFDAQKEDGEYLKWFDAQKEDEEYLKWTGQTKEQYEYDIEYAKWAEESNNEPIKQTKINPLKKDKNNLEIDKNVFEQQGEIMEYIFLDFTKNLENESKWSGEYYNQPLEEQFESLKRKHRELRYFNELRQFAVACCEGSMYYLSYPNYLREEKVIKGRRMFNNIVLRPHKSSLMEQMLPKGKSLIFICDLVVRQDMADLNVKGIEFIDEAIVTQGEELVQAKAFLAFTSKQITVANGSFSVPDYGVRPKEYISFFTNDNILRLQSNYTINNPQRVIKTNEEWKEYISFRKNYLQKQTEKGQPIDSVEYIKAYALPKKEYKRNESYKENLLDGATAFENSDLVMLNKKVDGAESYSLVKATVVRNKKELYTDCNKQGKPKFSLYLARFTRESMVLAYGTIDKKKRTDKIDLDDRYKLIEQEIEPSYVDIESWFSASVSKAQKDIEAKYNALITEKVSKYIAEKKSEIETTLNAELQELQNSLDRSLKTDIIENSDKKIILKQQELLFQYKKEIENQLKKEIDNYKNTAKKGKIDKNYISKLENEAQIELNVIPMYAKLESLYKQRNDEIIGIKQADNKKKLEKELLSLKMQKQNSLIHEYAKVKQDDEKQQIKELNTLFGDKKKVKKENETVIQYSIYFKIEGDNENDIKKKIESLKPNMLYYNDTAERTKIDRQDKALDSFFKGYVKNPFLSSYLFSPESLKSNASVLNSTVDYQLESLNEKQQEAVKKALASESLFLLQGPPGTGKTQVIAELVAQYALRGKKVLISSETHKAIDNVFERLPKIPEIRPLRLIPSQSNKETQYSPERLVDNFYKNIIEKMKVRVGQYKNYNEMKESFSDSMKQLELLIDKQQYAKSRIGSIELDVKKLENDERTVSSIIENLEKDIAKENEEKENIAITKRCVERLNFNTEDAIAKYVHDLKLGVKNIFSENKLFEHLNYEKANLFLSLDEQVIKSEIDNIDLNEVLQKLENEKEELKALMNSAIDLEIDDEEFMAIRGKLIEVSKKIKEEQKNNEQVDISNLEMSKIFKKSNLTEENLSIAFDEFVKAKRSLQNLITSIINEIEKEEIELDKVLMNLNDNVSKEKYNRKKITNSILELREADDFKQYELDEIKLKKEIVDFFKKFELVPTYKDNYEALDIIVEAWHEMNDKNQTNRKENEEKIPMYEKIIKYLDSEKTQEEDRIHYTKSLYDNVNVFGMTCTSRDSFNANAIKELATYGLDTIDVKRQGIDVVIVDEVSKSSFIDLLIPILYGKTVILVGDHRQLPPMYDLRHMREDEIESLDGIVTKWQNDEYTKMYEDSFFKQLFDSVPSDFKVMLNRQYRCHGDIMRVFNHFYGGNDKGLKLGFESQNDTKEHNLSVKIGGNNIIEPKRHIYFVDCKKHESQGDGTSKFNAQEADVVAKLLQELDASCGRINRKANEQKLSIGVICTYSDQAKKIRQRKNKMKFNNFNTSFDEKLVISTVDDFQGDERDIIIVSMVRNPIRRGGNNDFIKQFERINVALSRARKLLIVVGSKEYLENCGTIKLPDIEDANNAPQVNVYRDIIGTINAYGKVLSAEEVLGEE